MKFEDVVTSVEAVERWGLSSAIVNMCVQVKRACYHILQMRNVEIKETWLVTSQRVERLYGRLEE